MCFLKRVFTARFQNTLKTGFFQKADFFFLKVKKGFLNICLYLTATMAVYKVFEFVIRECVPECIELLRCLTMENVQYLYFQEEDYLIPKYRRPKGIKTKQIQGLIEMKKGTTINGMVKFFGGLGTPPSFVLTVIAVCRDVDFWRAYKLKSRIVGGVVVEKGTLTVPPYSPLF